MLSRCSSHLTFHEVVRYEKKSTSSDKSDIVTSSHDKSLQEANIIGIICSTKFQIYYDEYTIRKELKTLRTTDFSLSQNNQHEIRS